MSYDSVRSKLVTLSVDLEDKEKLCDVLKSKIDQARHALFVVEKEITTKYERMMEDENNSMGAFIEQIGKDISCLLDEKKSLMAKCEEEIEAIKQAEKDISLEMKKIYDSTELKIDQERRIFNQGFDSRLSQLVAKKLEEFKVHTKRAIQPEIDRQKELHKREMNAADQKFRADERKIQEEMAKKFQQLVEEGKADIRNNELCALQLIDDEFQREREILEREHKFKIVCLKEESERDIDLFREMLKSKLDKERKESREEMDHVEKTFRDRIEELKKNHNMELTALQRDKDNKIRNIKADYETKRKSLLQSSSEKPESTSFDEPSLKVSHSEMNVKSESEKSSAISSRIEEIQAKLMSDRESELQAEIRRMQTETIKLEKVWKKDYLEEKKRIQEASDREEQMLNTSLKHWNEEIADLLVEREDLAKDIKRNQDENYRLAEAVRELEKDIHVYEDGIHAKKMSMQDKETNFQETLRSLEQSYSRDIQEIKTNCERLTNQIRSRYEDFQKEQEDIQSKHNLDLERLDSEVKTRLQAKEMDIANLRDAILTEKHRLDRYEKLIKKYTGEKM